MGALGACAAPAPIAGAAGDLGYGAPDAVAKDGSDVAAEIADPESDAAQVADASMDTAFIDLAALDPPDWAASGDVGVPNPWLGQPVFLLSIDNAWRWLQKIDVTTAKTTQLCQLTNTGAYPSLTFRRDNVLAASYKGAGLDIIDPCRCKGTPVGSS